MDRLDRLRLLDAVRIGQVPENAEDQRTQSFPIRKQVGQCVQTVTCQARQQNERLAGDRVFRRAHSWDTQLLAQLLFFLHHPQHRHNFSQRIALGRCHRLGVHVHRDPGRAMTQ